MSSPSEVARGRVALSAEVEPDPVDAGAEMLVHVRAVCDPSCDLAGRSLVIEDDGGAKIGTSALGDFDEEANEASIRLNAPARPGEYRWSIALPPLAEDGIASVESSAPLSFAVRAHAVHLTVWDVPGAIVAGETFRIKLGAKCSSACDLSGRGFAILDRERAERASGNLGGDIWQGTDGLHFAEIELRAPEEPGLYQWSARVAASDAGLPHEDGTISFGVRTVRAPECVLEIEAVDRASGSPLPGALVTMRPYHAVADRNGIARIEAAKGSYRLFVAHKGYLNFAQGIELTGDAALKAALDIEVKPERN